MKIDPAFRENQERPGRFVNKQARLSETPCWVRRTYLYGIK